MVKDRLFTMNRSNFIARSLAIADGTRFARYRTAIVPLTARYRAASVLKKEKKNPYKGSFKLYLLTNYLTNLSVLRFNSTFTFLPNTNE